MSNLSKGIANISSKDETMPLKSSQMNISNPNMFSMSYETNNETETNANTNYIEQVRYGAQSRSPTAFDLSAGGG